MPDLTHTDFYQALEAPFSEALEVARVATDPIIEQHDEAYPPILTAAEFAGHIIARSDVIGRDDRTTHQVAFTKNELKVRLNKRLLTWTGEEFFEIAQLPQTEDEDVPVRDFGFRITLQGILTVESHIRDQAVTLMRNADGLNSRIKQL